jgi:glycosyltransferase involved in cell wall biosynthesis
MKILITQETDWLKRNPAQQHHLAERLSRRGHEIRVIDYEPPWRQQGKKYLRSRRQVFNDVNKIYPGAGVTVIRPGVIRLPWLSYFSLLLSHRREIKRQIREFSPDIIVGFGILNSYTAMKAVAGTGIPFICYWIDVLHLLLPSKIFRPFGKFVESMTLPKSDRVLVINEKLKEYVVRLGAPPAQTEVLRAGIDTSLFNANTDGRALRARYGLGKEDFVIFFMGWLYHFSGLKEVTRELAAAGNPGLKLLIVGEGDAYDELERLRREYHLENQVILAGRKNYRELPEFIATADICLLPAYPQEKIMQDIVPIKMYEYMAMGKPVISTALPGVKREFGEDNGVVYVPRPEDTISEALKLAHGGGLVDMGTRARQFATRNSWENITGRFEQILEEAVKARAGRGEKV